MLSVVWRRGSPGHRAMALGAIVLTPLVMAGYWYGRNLLLTGNPLYPLQVEAFGRVWLAGWYGPDAMRRERLLHLVPRLAVPGRHPGRDPRSQARADLGGRDRGGLVVGSGRSAMVGVDLGLLRAGGRQRGALLDLHPLPDGAAVHAPGRGAGRRAARDDPPEVAGPPMVGGRPARPAPAQPRGLAVFPEGRTPPLGPLADGPDRGPRPGHPARQPEQAPALSWETRGPGGRSCRTDWSPS